MLRLLTEWYNGEARAMRFAIPQLWCEPTNHHEDCYFCLTKLGKFGKHEYPHLASSSTPVPHGPRYPVPDPPGPSQRSGASTSFEESPELLSGSQDQELKSEEPRLFDQEGLNDFVRDLGLSKAKSELAASRLRERNLLEKGVSVTIQRTRHLQFKQYFRSQDGLCFCDDIVGLLGEMGIAHRPDEWRLFIDGSNRSLKAVLLHNEDIHRSIPIAYSTVLKENYDCVKMLLEFVNYGEHRWEVIGDFKMVAILMGLQAGNTKYPCFHCLWDSRAYANHYSRRDWPRRMEFVLGQHNVKAAPLVDQTKILMPPLHIKLGLMKKFVTALDPNSTAFQYIRNLFPKLSQAKVAAGVFVGPQIRKVFVSSEFRNLLNANETAAWDSFRATVEHFLGKRRAVNYKDLVDDLIKNFQAIGCTMSLKVHMLHAHLDSFKENLGKFSEEQGERFHQEIMELEERYRGKKVDENMLGDYMWNINHESEASHKRKR